MKKLHVLHSESQLARVQDIVDTLNFKQTDVVRAALFIGLKEISKLSTKDLEKAKDFVAINSLKSR